MGRTGKRMMKTGQPGKLKTQIGKVGLMKTGKPGKQRTGKKTGPMRKMKTIGQPGKMTGLMRARSKTKIGKIGLKTTGKNGKTKTGMMIFGQKMKTGTPGLVMSG